MLLDPIRLSPVDLGDAAVRELGTVGGAVREFFPSQVEFGSPVFEHAADALHSLMTFRAALGAWAADHDAIAAGTGTPRHSARLPRWEGRYARIADDIGALAIDHQINGLHVHIGVDDRDERVRASNALRAWLPVFLALSANSPFWHGSDTGFASWRAIHNRRWTTSGIPPWFTDATAYDDAVAALVGVGATSDPGTVNWGVRLSAKYPTVEIRVCDAQLTPRRAVALALLMRVLVDDASEDSPRHPRGFETWDAALWHAARHGLSGRIMHPVREILEPAADVLSEMRNRLLPRLSGLEGQLLDELLCDSTTGAQRQREAHARGGLADLYRDSLAGTVD